MTCAEDLKFEVVRRAAAHYRREHAVVDIDGARVTFPGGWGLVRASNTGAVLVLRFEADTAEHLAAIEGEMRGRLAMIIAEVTAETTTPGRL